MRLMLAGATSQTIYLSVNDSASTTGGKKTGIAYNTGSLVAYYTRNGAAAVAITLATQTVTGAWSSGGFVEVSSANAPGLYRLDLPDAAIAAGVPSVVVSIKGASGMVQVDEEIQLTAVNLQDAVRLGLTALPNAAAEAAGGLFTRGSGAGQLNQQSNGLLDANVARWLNTAPATPNLAGVPIVDGRDWIRVGTAQAGSTTTITLDSGASAQNLLYAFGGRVTILSGTGAGQTRMVSNYVGSTKVATVVPSWAVAPDNTSVFAILPWGGADVQLYVNNPASVSSLAGTPKVDVGYWLTNAPPTPTIAGVPIVDLKYILGTVLTETAGQIAAGFKKLFNVAVPVMTVESVNQTGDAYAKVDTEVADIQARLPAALVGGRIDASVGAMASGVVTAAAVATDAIDADALAADAITEIQSGLATSSALAIVQADTDDLQTRIPSALVGGKMDSHVNDVAAGAITAAAIATDAIDADAVKADAVTEIQSGLATAAALATVQADTDDIQARLPAALVSGRMASDAVAISGSTTAADAVEANIANLDAAVTTRATQTSVDAIDDYVDTEVAAIKAKTDNLPASPAAVSNIPTANQNADALLDRVNGVETDWTVREAMRIMLSALAGKVSGAGTATISFRDLGDTLDRIVATTTADGDRTAVTLDAS